jgi:hypothetical protein
MLSEQVGAWQTLPTQSRLTQSVLELHPPPVPQGAQFGPPQSTPVSPSFWMPSEQESAWQTVPAQWVFAA